MEVETIFELCIWGFPIFIIIWCFSILFTGLKEINEINDIMKGRESKKK